MYAIIVSNGKVTSAILIVGVLLLLLLKVNCDNYTQTYPWDTFQTRENRLITFNTLEQGDIELELEFHVPFLTIPVKKTMSGALANINVGAIALTGAIVFGAVVALPGLLALLNKKGGEWSSSMYKTVSESDAMMDDNREEMKMMNMASQGKFNNGSNAMKNEAEMSVNEAGDTMNASRGSGSEKRNKRLDDAPPLQSSTYQWWHHLLANLDTSFMQDMRSTACLQRAICWTIRGSSSRMQSTQGAASSVDKIVDGLATNEWVRYWARGSLFDSAINHGLRRSNCAKVYGDCRLSQGLISMLVKRLSATINNA